MRVFQDLWLNSSTCMRPQKASTTALSYGQPTAPIDGEIPRSWTFWLNAHEVNWADSIGRRNTSRWRWSAMGVRERQQAVRAMRGQMWSPGRPSTARREDRVRFWEAVAQGLSTEDAAAQAGVSPAVGSRWFRQAGGMPPISLAPVSGRYLSFSEREEIAIMRAQRAGVREIAHRLGRAPSTISLRASAQCLHAHVSPGIPGNDRTLARRAARQPPQGLQARRQRRASPVRQRSPGRCDRQA